MAGPPLAKARVEYAESAQEIEESEPRVGETNSGVTEGTRFKSTRTRTETALFCNGCLTVGAWRARPYGSCLHRPRKPRRKPQGLAFLGTRRYAQSNPAAR